MGRIKLNEKKLKGIIRESIKKVLNEEALYSDKKYKLDAIGDILRIQNQLAQFRYNKEIEATPIDWVNYLKRQRNGANLANTIYQNITSSNQEMAGAAEKANSVKGSYAQLGSKYAVGPGDNVMTQGKMTYSQLTNAMANVGDRTMTFQMALNDSVGPWNGQNPQTVKNIIASQIRTRKQTALQKFGQQNVATAEASLNSWLNGGNQATTGKQVHSWMNVFDQIATSRNDKPLVTGFQKAANFFAGQKVLEPDGIIGKHTSAALQQAGFRDIFDFQNVLKKVQPRIGVNPSGIVDAATLAAFGKVGISSFEDLKNYNRNLSVNLQNGPALNPQNQIQGQASPGQLAERRRMKVSESELKKVIRESVNDVLREMRLK